MSEPPNPNDRTITFLRICISMLPGVLLAAGFVFYQKLGNPLALVPVPILVVLIGYFEGWLALRQHQIDPTFEKFRLLRWSIFYLLLQIVIAPVFALLTLLGCALVGSFWLP